MSIFLLGTHFGWMVRGFYARMFFRRHLSTRKQRHNSPCGSEMEKKHTSNVCGIWWGNPLLTEKMEDFRNLGELACCLYWSDFFSAPIISYISWLGNSGKLCKFKAPVATWLKKMWSLLFKLWFTRNLPFLLRHPFSLTKVGFQFP